MSFLGILWLVHIYCCFHAGPPVVPPDHEHERQATTDLDLRLMWTNFSEVSPRLDAPIFKRVRILGLTHSTISCSYSAQYRPLPA
jgi:hypothetical protein